MLAPRTKEPIRRWHRSKARLLLPQFSILCRIVGEALLAFLIPFVAVLVLGLGYFCWVLNDSCPGGGGIPYFSWGRGPLAGALVIVLCVGAFALGLVIGHATSCLSWSCKTICDAIIRSLRRMSARLRKPFTVGIIAIPLLTEPSVQS